MDMAGGSTTVPMTGYTCPGCGQYIQYSWGVHTCMGRAYWNQPFNSLSYEQGQEIIRLLREIEYFVRTKR